MLLWINKGTNRIIQVFIKLIIISINNIESDFCFKPSIIYCIKI